MKKAFRWLVLALVACMVLSFAACTPSDDPTPSTDPKPSDSQPADPQPTDPKELTIRDGIYISDAIDMGKGRGMAFNYLRFHENGVFYYAQMAQPGSAAGGAMSAAGYYEVINESIAFTDTTGNEQTADFYILCYNFDGTEYGIHQSNGGEEGVAPEYDNVIPVKGDVLYGVWYSNMAYTHVADNTDYTVDKEIPKEVANFVKEAGSTEALILKHNGTFEDLVNITGGEYYEGSWTLADGVYTLTDNTTSKTATLQIAEDNSSASYVDFNGNNVQLLNAAAPATPSEGVLQVLFKGEFAVNGMFPGTTVASLYDNGTAKLETKIDMSLAGMGVKEVAEEGTWELTADYKMVITVPVEGAEAKVFTAAPVDAQGTYKFTYNFSMQGSTGMQTFEVEMTKTALVEATFSGEFKVNDMFPGSSVITLEMSGKVKCDSSIDMNLAGMGVVSVAEEGSWTYDAAADAYTIVVGEQTYTAAKNADGVYAFTYVVAIQGSTGMQQYEVPVIVQ